MPRPVLLALIWLVLRSHAYRSASLSFSASSSSVKTWLLLCAVCIHITCLGVVPCQPFGGHSAHGTNKKAHNRRALHELRAREEHTRFVGCSARLRSCGCGRKTSGLNNKVRPEIGEVIRPQFAPRDPSLRESFDGHAMFWGEPSLAGSPVSNISDVVITKGASHCGRAAKVLGHALGR